MARADDMAARMHPVLREGALVRLLLGLFAVHVERLDDEAREVQRAHWWPSALDLDEIVRLAALLDLTPEPNQNREEFVAWVDTLRDAFLAGAVTRSVIQRLVRTLAARYEAANSIDRAGIDAARWSDTPDGAFPRFIENPRVRRFQAAGVEPLATIDVDNRGLDTSVLSILYVGLDTGPEYQPLLVNLDTGAGLIFHGEVPVGARLWVTPGADGGATANLEGVDVTDRLRTIANVTPGQPWTPEDSGPPRALTLGRGNNRLWFLPVAHYGERGLDRVLLALADTSLTQGRFEAGRFDHALFHQPAAARLHLSWEETAPASIRIELSGMALRHRPGRLLQEGLPGLAEVGETLGRMVDLVAAAGVATEVAMVPARSCQPQRDRLRFVGPVRLTETGTMGIDRLPDSGARFDRTALDQSLFR